MMTQAILERVLKDIETLQPDEIRQVQRFIEVRLVPPVTDDPDERVLQEMLEAGLISEIKRPRRNPKPERRLIPLQGKPLSETIIEERR